MLSDLFFGTDPWPRGAPTPQNISTLFFFFHNEPIRKHAAHLSLPFYTGLVSDALFSIQAAAGCGFIQLFDSLKRASGKIPTDRASEPHAAACRDNHYTFSTASCSRTQNDPLHLCLNRVCWWTPTSQHLRYQRNLLALFGHHWEPRCCYQPPSIIKPYAPCPPNTALFIPPCCLMTSRVKWSELSGC